MKILSAQGIQQAEVIHMQKSGISALELMEIASESFVNWFLKAFPDLKSIKVFCGPGKNGGDGLVIARLLHQLDYTVTVYTLHSQKYAPEYAANKILLEKLTEIIEISGVGDFPFLEPNAVVLDALFGIGINKPLEGLAASLVQHLNKSKGKIIAIDIASGLMPSDFTPGEAIVEPFFTATFQLPKLSFMLPANTKNVGEDFKILDIGIPNGNIEAIPSEYFYLNKEFIQPLIKKRSKFGHKGTYGKALIIGGHYGMIGAVMLAGKACYCAGAGLLKLYVPGCGYAIIQTAFPEAMVLTDPSENEITKIPDLSAYNAIAFGPGMEATENSKVALKVLLEKSPVPLVLDAGALNMLGKHRELMALVPPNSILTPHPKEFERLTQSFPNDYEKLKGLQEFSKQIQCIIILKGANTAVALPDGRIFFNSTGNPGMATGGSGDVLTGIITGLMAQAYTPEEAAIVGVFLHGYAGDVAALKYSQEAMLAGNIIEAIGVFYKEMQL